MLPAQISTPTYAALLPRGIWGQIADPFDYIAEFLPLNAGVTAPFEVNIQNDSDFLLVQMIAQVTSTDNQTPTPFFPALVTLLDAGAGRQLSSRAVHFHNYFSSPVAAAVASQHLVHVLPVPKLIDRGSTFTVTIQSLFAATNVNVRIAFQGFKLFGPRRPQIPENVGDLVTMARALLERAAVVTG